MLWTAPYKWAGVYFLAASILAPGQIYHDRSRLGVNYSIPIPIPHTNSTSKMLVKIYDRFQWNAKKVQLFVNFTIVLN